MLADPSHAAKLSGTVTVPVLDPQPLTVIRGEFNLFVRSPDYVNARLMCYRMLLASGSRTKFYFDGFKVARDDPGFDLWSDTTMLYITIFRGEDSQAPILGRGILHILPKDLMHQLTTIRATNASNKLESLKTEARFGRFFAGILFEVYGSVFAKASVFNADLPPRKKRPLRTSAPQVHFFKTADGVQLRLTRYAGGSKGPVVLAHGLGVSSLIFAIDTVDTNLVEYLFEHEFDVWLLDFRASIDLPAAASQFTADDVATKDYPAAVDKVRELTGTGSVQVVAHCYGSTTFCMAMCAGLKGVRSAVCSQIATHIVAPTANRVRTGLHLPEFLDQLGVTSLNAYVDTHADWLNRLYDRTLGLYAVGEHCNNSVCRRITFMYAQLYRHEQLNEGTHNALHEMFGIANIHAFEGLAVMTRKGHIVAADAADVYLPNLECMAIPIAFLHAEKNECFLPRSTEVSYDLLRQTNGDLYSRSVIPGYGHIDCIFGRNAAKDVYPLILKHLDATSQVGN